MCFKFVMFTYPDGNLFLFEIFGFLAGEIFGFLAGLSSSDVCLFVPRLSIASTSALDHIFKMRPCPRQLRKITKIILPPPKRFKGFVR